MLSRYYPHVPRLTSGETEEEYGARARKIAEHWQWCEISRRWKDKGGNHVLRKSTEKETREAWNQPHLTLDTLFRHDKSPRPKEERRGPQYGRKQRLNAKKEER